MWPPKFIDYSRRVRMGLVLAVAVAVCGLWLFVIAGEICRSSGPSMEPTYRGRWLCWFLRWTPPRIGDVVVAEVRDLDHRVTAVLLHRVIACDGHLMLLCGDNWRESRVDIVPIEDVRGVVVGARDETIAGLVWELLPQRFEAEGDVAMMAGRMIER